MTTREVADLAGRSMRAVQSAIAAGKLEAVLVAGHWMVRTTAAKAYALRLQKAVAK